MACIPHRYQIAIMMFIMVFLAYMMRGDIAILLINMAGATDKSFVPECIKRQNKTFNLVTNKTGKPKVYDYYISESWRGHILSSFFYGYFVSNIVSGFICEKIGPRKTISICMILAGISDILIPFVAKLHQSAVCVCRVLIGFFSGCVYPGMQVLYSKWAPVHERGRMNIAMFGASLATITTWPLFAYLTDGFSYYCGFVMSGGLTIIGSIIFFFVVYDTPAVHPRIKPEEMNYINDSIPKVPEQRKKFPPYKQILTSGPFYAFCNLCFGSLWGIYFFLTEGPHYISSVIGEKLTISSIYAALPSLSHFVFGICFGFIGDYADTHWKLKTASQRKFFVLFSHILPGVCMALLIFSECDTIWVVTLDVLALGLNGADVIVAMTNALEIAPKYAGSIFGIANAIGTLAGIIIPVQVGALTSHNNGVDEWKIVFAVSAAVYVLTGIIFIAFGSSAVQPWNYIEDIEVDAIAN